MTESVLSDELLARIRGRAAGYDRENVFFHEDLAELTEVGYLRLFTPVEHGGLGRGLRDVAREQTRLATAAPATALAINMHQVWTGVAKVLLDRGDESLLWLLKEAAAGELFAFGNSEAGNDQVLFDSRTRAEPDGDGGYRYHGTKIFTSMSPAWTRLGIFGRDDSDPDNPRLVHGFITRDSDGFTSKDDWDTLGMRASQSCTTVLHGVRVPAERISRNLPVGSSADLFIFGIFANFELLLAAVYAGIGQRAIELAVESARRRTSLKHDGRSLADDPDIRWRIADAALWQDGLYSQIDQAAADVDNLVDHQAAWFPKLVGVKVRVTETVREVVDKAIRASGGSSYFSSSELGRLYRDVLAGLFHPSDDESAHNTFANAVLGPQA